MLTKREKRQIPILMYHSIAQSTNPKFKQFALPPASFADQMAYLYNHQYTPITVTQLINALWNNTFILPERSVVLTFDDGFADFFTEALPVLKQYGFVATLYVATSFINGTSRWLQHMGEGERRMLTWEQLAEINAYGVECGAHSHTHPQLDTLPLLVVQDEILQCKRLLEDHLDQNIFSFAYPYGYFTAEVRQAVQSAGYTSACAVRHAMSSKLDDPLSLARLQVGADSTLEKFVALLTGRGVSPVMMVYTLYARTRTPIWQFVRRSTASLAPR